MHELKSKLQNYFDEISRGIESINITKIQEHLTKLKTQIQSSNFWDDPKKASQISQEADHLEKKITNWLNIQIECQDLIDLIEESEKSEDYDAIDEIKPLYDEFEKKWQKLAIETFLNGKYDKLNAIINIFTGNGGKDAHDFSEMLLRMYLRYCEQNNFKAEILDKSEGEEIGIKSATILVKEPLAYGILKGESGVHRLIRLSPFNSKGSRETSFSKIEVLPDIPEVEMEEIPKDELRIETFRASGAGGQHVNTTDSAVRITHIPTGLTAQCQNERSQLQNRETTMRILQAKIQQLKEEQQAQTLNELKGSKTENSWGHQIRTYTLQPYTLAKDHRTNYEDKNVQKVLDGNIEGFLTAFLEQQKNI
jgi:peptide chain release factor 2